MPIDKVLLGRTNIDDEVLYPKTTSDIIIHIDPTLHTSGSVEESINTIKLLVSNLITRYNIINKTNIKINFLREKYLGNNLELHDGFRKISDFVNYIIEHKQALDLLCDEDIIHMQELFGDINTGDTLIYKINELNNMINGSYGYSNIIDNNNAIVNALPNGLANKITELEETLNGSQSLNVRFNDILNTLNSIDAQLRQCVVIQNGNITDLDLTELNDTYQSIIGDSAPNQSYDTLKEIIAFIKSDKANTATLLSTIAMYEENYDILMNKIMSYSGGNSSSEYALLNQEINKLSNLLGSPEDTEQSLDLNNGGTMTTYYKVSKIIDILPTLESLLSTFDNNQATWIEYAIADKSSYITYIV